jgi:hypothetical protein
MCSKGHSVVGALTLLGYLVLAAAALAEEQPQAPGGSGSAGGQPTATSGNSERWLLICCGLPGDEEHRALLTKACRDLISAAEPLLGVTSARLRVLVGDDEMQDAISDVAKNIEVCTKASVKTAIEELNERVPQDAACWIVLLGHAHLYGQRCQFNVSGEDIDQKAFGEWSNQLTCREQVFLITLPVSGFWIRPLRAPSRVVISATEADLEFTGTEMPYALADVLSGNGAHAALEDHDADGSVSLLDLYIAVNLEIHGRFKARERLQTEHAQLDDNGDGRGSELQFPYLPKEEEESDDAELVEETPKVKPKIISNPNLDGYRSRHVLLKTVGEKTVSE